MALNVFAHINKYGQEWQVNHDDPQLFRTINGPHFPLEQCKIPSSFQTTECQHQLGDSSVVKHSVAKKTCCDHICNQDDFDACVLDIILTGDMEVAAAY
jgi:hypothetical protein